MQSRVHVIQGFYIQYTITGQLLRKWVFNSTAEMRLQRSRWKSKLNLRLRIAAERLQVCMFVRVSVRRFVSSLCGQQEGNKNNTDTKLIELEANQLKRYDTVYSPLDMYCTLLLYSVQNCTVQCTELYSTLYITVLYSTVLCPNCVSTGNWITEFIWEVYQQYIVRLPHVCNCISPKSINIKY